MGDQENPSKFDAGRAANSEPSGEDVLMAEIAAIAGNDLRPAEGPESNPPQPQPEKPTEAPEVPVTGQPGIEAPEPTIPTSTPEAPKKPAVTPGNSPRPIPFDPNHRVSKERMKKVAETPAENEAQTAKNWEEFNNLVDHLTSKYPISITMGKFVREGKSVNAREVYQENINGMRRLDGILSAFPAESVKGWRFVPGSENKGPAVATDKRVEFNVHAPESELLSFFEATLGATPETASKDEPAPAAAPEPAPIANNEPEPVVSTLESAAVTPATVDMDLDKAPDAAGGEYVDAEIISSSGGSAKPAGELKELLDLARIRYVAAKKAHAKFEGIRKAEEKSGYHESSTALEKAQAEYAKAQAEYVGANVERYLAEKEELVESHLAEYGKLDSNWSSRLKRGYDYLGDLSLYNLYKSKGYNVDSNWVKRAVLKAANGRMLINTALLGTGVGTAYMGMHGVTGAVLLTRSAFSGTFSAIGSRGLLEMARGALGNKPYTAEQVSKLSSLDQVEERMAQLEARAFFDGGSYEVIKSGDEYQALKRRQGELYRAYSDPAERERVFAQRLNDSEEARRQAIRKEQSGRRATLIGGAVIGAAVGGLAAKNAVDSWAESRSTPSPASATPAEPGRIPVSEIPLEKAPEPYSIQPEARAIPESPSEPDAAVATEHIPDAEPASHDAEAIGELRAKLDKVFESSAKPPAAAVEVTSRGIEGTLADLKLTDPDRYKSMIGHLRSQYAGQDMSDGTLIHKAVVDLAARQGYTVDGGGLDLSDIKSAKINFGEDGSFWLDQSELDFADNPSLDDAPHEAVQKLDGVKFKSAAQPSEVLESRNVWEPADAKLGPEDIENETLDFKHLNPDYDPLKEAATSEMSERRFEALYKDVGERQMGAALRNLLKKEYKPFVENELKVSGWDLTRIQRMSVREFQQFSVSPQTPPKVAAKYEGLVQATQKFLDASPSARRAAFEAEPMRKLIIRMASSHLAKVHK